ncbi:hypothetical protein VrSk94_11160 [Vibrio rotiferianus]
MSIIIDIAASRGSRVFMPLFAGILTAALASFSGLLVEKELSKTVDKYPAFEAAVIQSLNNSSSLNLGQATLLFEAVHPTGEIVNHQFTLRSYLVRLNYQLMLNKTEPSVEQENLVNFTEKVQAIISNLEEVRPYQELAPIEASIFQDISALTDDEEIERKLRQLSSIFQVRFEELEQSKAEARWSLIFGIAGLVAGVVSILLSVFPVTRSKPKS